MKTKIHPNYYPEAKVICASCGSTWTTGSTEKEIRTEVCSNCHPFYTGQLQRILDVEGQVDRFYKKLQARQDFIDQRKARVTARTSPERSIDELSIGGRAKESLSQAGITNVGQVLDKLAQGDKAMLEIDGFGRKSLIDMKKSLKSLGYVLPNTAEEPAA